ncbi:YojF family protein [Alkalihalobacillus sp. BA299]|uniref:YojF family protein n=1 Tax=Alkalihalobacillus sp. BA299 TaxID=2815938 RepID=UPI001AD9D381|nr:YojF family protein [Alkalihalobacillus sp. BA299]
MEAINKELVQQAINHLANREVYVHLETTNGAYTAYRNGTPFSAGVFIRNSKISFEHGKVTGEGPFRVGLKIELGWVYAEGVTHWTMEGEQILLAGLDDKGRLAVSLQLSPQPFK